MRLHSIRNVAYSHPLRPPITTVSGTYTVRTGWYVALHCTDGFAGVGEVATLPEAGTETPEQAERELARLESRTEFPELPQSLQESEDWIQACGLSAERTPALCYALECALSAILEMQSGRSLSIAQGRRRASQVAICPVIGGGSDAGVLAAAESHTEAGYGTLKVKVGMRSVADDVRLIQELRAAFPRIGLRADANGAWDLNEAKKFCWAVGPCSLQYVEDPLRDPSVRALQSLKQCGVAIALDELARSELVVNRILRRNLADAIILKPAAIGSFRSISRMAQRAHEQMVEVVLSNLYESGVGLIHGLNLAAALGSRKLAHGLYPTLAPSYSDAAGTVILISSMEGKVTPIAAAHVPEFLWPELLQPLGFPVKHSTP